MLSYAVNTTILDNCLFFGLTVILNDKIIKKVTSLSENKYEVENLVNMCNQLEIEQCHIDDIIDDFLTDFHCWDSILILNML